jgi:5S rRNA maturation endonuclease (ribonuclease M5)
MVKEINRIKDAKQRRRGKYSSALDNGDNNTFYLLELERAKRLKEFLQLLYEINKSAPLIVEGKRDLLALRKLGFTGEIITVHSGRGLYDFCHSILERFNKVILLMDWDENGDILQEKLSDNLHGLWEEFSHLRDVLRMLCQKDVKAIEDIPTLLRRLSGTDVKVGESDGILD